MPQLCSCSTGGRLGGVTTGELDGGVLDIALPSGAGMTKNTEMLEY